LTLADHGVDIDRLEAFFVSAVNVFLLGGTLGRVHEVHERLEVRERQPRKLVWQPAPERESNVELGPAEGR